MFTAPMTGDDFYTTLYGDVGGLFVLPQYFCFDMGGSRNAGTPIVRWFISWKLLLEWMITWGTLMTLETSVSDRFLFWGMKIHRSKILWM